MTADADDTAKRSTRSRKKAAEAEAEAAAEKQPRASAADRASSRTTAKTKPADEPAEPKSESERDGVDLPAATARADEMVDLAGQRVGQLLTDLSHRLRVASARAREEAEDIWAEAQSLRDKTKHRA